MHLFFRRLCADELGIVLLAVCGLSECAINHPLRVLVWEEPLGLFFLRKKTKTCHRLVVTLDGDVLTVDKDLQKQKI